MQNILLVMTFILGLFTIVTAGRYFVEAAIKLAHVTKIPEAIIGATLVSIATTLPELSVSTIAAHQNAQGIALGNCAGTMIFNISFVLGIYLLVRSHSYKSRSSFVSKAIILFLASILLIVLGLDYFISIGEGVILLILFIAFVLDCITIAKSEIKKSQIVHPNNPKVNNKVLFELLIIFVLSAAALLVGADLTVGSASEIAYLLGMSETAIGLTIVAMGTSLPEFITMITSVMKKKSELGIANVIGANIINSTIIFGSSTIIAGGFIVEKQTLFITLPAILLITTILMAPILIKNRTYRWQGALLLLIGVLYNVIILFNLV